MSHLHDETTRETRITRCELENVKRKPVGEGNCLNLSRKVEDVSEKGDESKKRIKTAAEKEKFEREENSFAFVLHVQSSFLYA